MSDFYFKEVITQKQLIHSFLFRIGASRVLADRSNSHRFISVVIPFSGYYNALRVFIKLMMFTLLAFQMPYQQLNSLSVLQCSSSLEVHVSQKADDCYQFGCSLSNKPKNCIPISNAKLQQDVFFFSPGKERSSLNLKLHKKSNMFRHLVAKKTELTCAGLRSAS